MAAAATTLVDSNTALGNLATGNISVIADYAFSNPYSINGPFGTLSLTLSSSAMHRKQRWGQW